MGFFMAITTTQAETAIYKLIGLHNFTGIDKKDIRIENQQLPNGTAYVAPTNKPHCKVFISYSDSQTACISNKPLIRDFGIISVQCFVPRNTGTLDMSKLVDQWRDLLQSFTIPFLEVYLVHAPQNASDDNFHGKIIRAEFRLN